MGCASKGIDYDCKKLFQQVPAPPWVTNGAELNSKKFIGIGSAHKAEDGFQGQEDRAYTAAKNDLARAIRTNVEVTITHYANVIDGKLSRDEFIKLSNHHTNVLLRGVERDSRWVNQETCMVWVKVSVPKKDILSLLKQQLQEKYTLEEANNLAFYAKNDYSNLDSSLSIIEQAVTKLRTINFELLLVSGLSERGFNSHLLEYKSILESIKSKIRYKVNSSEELYLESVEIINKIKTYDDHPSVQNLIETFYLNIRKLKQNKKYCSRDLKTLEIQGESTIRAYRKRETKANIKKNKMLFLKALERIHQANSRIKDENYVKKQIVRVKEVKRYLEKNSQYSEEKDLRELENKLSELEYSFEKVINFLDYIRIGMPIDEVHREYGKPIKHRKEKYQGSEGLKYGRYWLIFKHGALDCVVHERNFIPLENNNLRNCREHRKKKVNLIKD